MQPVDALHVGLSIPPQNWNSAAVVGAGVASTEGTAMTGECEGYRVGAFVGKVGPGVAPSSLGKHCPHFPFGVFPAAQPEAK